MTHRLGIVTASIALLAAGRAEATEPSITAGTLLTPAVNVQVAPAQVALSVSIDQGTTGAKYILASMMSPSGMTIQTGFIQVPVYPPTRKIKVPFQLVSPFVPGGLTLYSEPGTWTITSVTLLTNDNQFVSYSGSQLAALFGNQVTVAVTNSGTPDTKPPVYGRGKILTPTVSLSASSPIFAVNIAVRDDISGVSTVYVEYQPPSGNAGGTSSVISAPLKEGKVDSYAILEAGSPVGTYTLTSLSVCDYAGNCVTDSSTSDLAKIFGAATFQVTN
jgi:hypothetical protein